MRKFITQIALFVVLACAASEIIIRAFKLTSDIPQRTIDSKTGIQLLKPGQSGYYKKAKEKWTVNKYGWLGIANTNKKPLFSIIGDSYIENIMNPISCNQGYILQKEFEDYSFFEAGRSGVTFIEGMEISKYLDSLIQPTFHLIYVGNGDFNESILSKGRYTDRMQIDLEKRLIIKSKMKSPIAKRILYSSKFLYYMYLRFPVLVEKQNMGEINENAFNKSKLDTLALSKLFEYCSEEYDLNKIILIFHPMTADLIRDLANYYGFKSLLLNETSEKWALGLNDGHWSCYGHNEAAKQIIPMINNLVNEQNRKVNDEK